MPPLVKESSRTMGTVTRIVVSSKTDPDPGVDSIANKVNSFIYLPVHRVVRGLCPYINLLSLGTLAIFPRGKL